MTDTQTGQLTLYERQQIFTENTIELMEILHQLVMRVFKFERDKQKQASNFFDVFKIVSKNSGVDGISPMFGAIFEAHKLQILYDTSTQWLFYPQHSVLDLGGATLPVGEMCAILANTFDPDDRDMITRIDMMFQRVFYTIYGVDNEFQMIKKRITAHEKTLGLIEDDGGVFAGAQGMVSYVSEMIDNTLPNMPVPEPIKAGIKALQQNIKTKDLSTNTIDKVLETVNETSQSTEGQQAKQFIHNYLQSQPGLQQAARTMQNVDGIDKGMEAIQKLANDPVVMNNIKETVKGFAPHIPQPNLSAEEKDQMDATLAGQDASDEPGYM